MKKIDHPKTPEEFFKDYKDFVYQWLKIKKYYTIDAHEFFSSFTQKIIESLGKPITGTSANISNVAPTKDINEIKQTFNKKVSIIADIDCGPENLSSTVIKIDNNKSGIDILREGPVSLEKIKKVINL